MTNADLGLIERNSELACGFAVEDVEFLTIGTVAKLLWDYGRES